MQGGEVRIATRPHRILRASFPGLAQGIEGFCLLTQAAIDAGCVVEDRSFVGAKSNRKIKFSQSIGLA